ncbi:unnamed protein product [Meloidogyne enterolobii]|uniref:Uncharacterized protein n=1 Tax=Meloidogyne enterolobii TaxID=390850 RepID=A0ACB0Y3G9_MELEN
MKIFPLLYSKKRVKKYSLFIISSFLPPLFFHFAHFFLLISILPSQLLFGNNNKDNALYTCAAYNQELKEYKFSNNQFNFNVKKRHATEKLRNMPPEQQWVNQSSPIALLGHIHKLHCFFSGFPNPTPIWYHNGIEITSDNSRGFSFENFGKTLVFNVTAQHIGRYDCKFERHASIDRTFDIKLNAAPYWFDLPPASVNTSEGETVVFDCKTLGNPTPVVTFYKNGVELRRPRPGENWVIEGSKLTIYDVKKGANGLPGDNAVYQCKSENKHGYLWTNFYLNLLAFQPQLLEEPGQVEAIEGKPFSLQCKFFSSPQATVTWESPVLGGVPYSTKVDQFCTGWLLFEEVRRGYDGEYKCTGVNKYGSASATQKLVVRIPTLLDPFTKQRMEHRAGIPMKLPCEAKHDPDLDVQYIWTINGRDLAQANKEIGGGHYHVTEDNTLVIEQPTQEDSGMYTCLVKTKLDEISKSITVNIEDVPQPVHSARISSCNIDEPIVTIDFEHYEPADRSKPVEEFWIRYSVDQEVDQGKWQTYPVPLKALPHETVGESLRLVRGQVKILLKPFGTYTFQVIARNAIGDSAPYIIDGMCQTSQKPPTRNPSGVWLQGTQPDNLIVYWEPMARDEWNAENFAYRILYRRKEEGGDWKSITVEDPFADKYTIDLGDGGARAWDQYEVQVRAINGKGASTVMPEVVEGRTGEGEPGVTPTNFRLIQVTSTSAEFEWDSVDPSKVQGNFSGYKITYWYDENSLLDNESNNKIRKARHRRAGDLSSGSGNFERNSVVFAPGVTRGTITGLKPNSINYAVISVLNGQNEGAPSQELSFRTKEGVPTPVRDLRAYPMNNRHASEHAVVVLKWHPPRERNGRLIKYTVVHCRASDGDDPESEEFTNCGEPVDVNRRLTELRIINLRYNTKYRFEFTAHTGGGMGLLNSVDAHTLPEALHLNIEPSKPSLYKEGIGDDHFNISFVPGHYDSRVGAPVGNSFYVKYRETDSGDEWLTKEPPPDGLTLQVTVDRLTPGTKYDVMTVSLQRDEAGNIVGQTESRIHHITTTGVSPRRATLYWLLIILLILLLLLLFICIACCLLHQRGRKYFVEEKERLHGREPMLPKDKQFEEFGKTPEDIEKRSLSGHMWGGESESDSLVADVDDNQGYNEDGSFVNQYGANNRTGLVHSGSGPEGSQQHPTGTESTSRR